MRRFYLSVIMCAAMILAACSGDMGVEDQFLPKYQLSFRADLDSRIFDRVTMEGDRYVWIGNEQLGVYIASQTPTLNAKASITLDEWGLAHCSTAVHSFEVADVMYTYLPYSQDNASTAPSAVAMSIPAEQRISAAGEFCGDAMPMVGDPYLLSVGEQDVPVRVRPLGSLLRFNLYASGDYAGEKVRSVAYTTTTPLAGEFVTDLTAGLLTIGG